MGSLSITEQREERHTLLELRGEIDISTYQNLRRILKKTSPYMNLVVDMAGVTRVSSSGLGVLMEATNDSRKSGHTLHLSGTTEIVRLAMESTGSLAHFTLVKTIEDAVGK
jgi:anti-anti-sigma factor